MSDIVNYGNKAAISARVLLLDLFTTGEHDTLTSRQLNAVGAAFGLSREAMRTALARLRAEGRLRAVARGVYAAGAQGDPIRARAAVWRRHVERRVAWDGGWIGAAIRPTRVARTRWRRTQWALEFLGFRQDETGLWLRPDNLDGGAPAVAAELAAFGAAPSMAVFRMDHVAPAHAARFATLWDVQALAAGHAAMTAALRRSRAQLGEGAPAAVETLLTGRRAIREILRDPLLPLELAGPATPDALAREMAAYDACGKAIWRRFLAELA
ncbi:type IV toxin-antitoxin system AbiEi family antitoxin domain-containing protein [Camelimonas abortus]|uniref:Type IV toxin-antitoxin system AbiEi family antitoxin domain-containing protein n=1 Tax=Camelimonas abortus TaxID=1017184 RepID=A0ABV7LB93_9HYPH